MRGRIWIAALPARRIRTRLLRHSATLHCSKNKGASRTSPRLCLTPTAGPAWHGRKWASLHNTESKQVIFTMNVSFLIWNCSITLVMTHKMVTCLGHDWFFLAFFNMLHLIFPISVTIILRIWCNNMRLSKWNKHLCKVFLIAFFWLVETQRSPGLMLPSLMMMIPLLLDLLLSIMMSSTSCRKCFPVNQ